MLTREAIKGKAGFTLMELIITILLIASLSAIGAARYKRVVERSRAREAMAILDQIRSAEEGYRNEFGTYVGTNILNPAAAENQASMLAETVIPRDCVQVTHYFSYAITLANEDNLGVTATRCTGATGKRPGAVTGYTVVTDHTGLVTVSNPWYQ